MVETGGWGGIGHYAHCLCNALSQQGGSVRLVTHAINYELSDFDKQYDVEQVFRGDGQIADWRRLVAVQQDSSIVHFQSLLSTRRDWLMFRLVGMLNPSTKYIITVHNVLPHEVAWGETWAYRQLYKSASGLIVHSQASKDSLFKLMGQDFDVPVEVIPHGHYGELSADANLTRQQALDALNLTNQRYMVCFGAIRPYKGVDLLLRAVAAISDWPEEMAVLVIGRLLTGVTEQELLDLRRELKIEDRVRFDFDYVPEENIPAVFAVSDLMLLPYRNIDQSGILMASMAAGKPVICTPVGAFPEVVDTSFGFLSADTSVQAIASSIQQALDTRDQWDVMGKAAKQVAESEFGWESIARKTLDFYARIANQ